jgi:hypothetical protein
MAMNQIERAILIAARTYIADGREERICHAINRGCELVHGSTTKVRSEAVRNASSRLRCFIMEQIKVGGAHTFGLESWVSDKLPGCAPCGKPDRMRATRLAWIDWLLDEPWTDWSGGVCPLLGGEHVIIRLRNGQEMGHNGQRRADTVRWFNAVDMPGFTDWATNHDVVAYKVIYEAPTC